MSGQLKEVRNRIKSVQSSQQITKAMKMVSAAKLRRAQEAILLMRPYALKLQEMLQNIVSNSEGDIDMALAAQRQVDKVLVVVITSDRGLCGAYNSNLIKLSKQLIREKYAEQFAQGKVDIMPIGKKGYEHFVKNGYKINDKFWQLFGNLNFEHVKEAAAVALEGFVKGQYDAVEIVYSQFKNAATQFFVSEQFLPIAKVEPTAADNKKAIKADFIFEPEKETLIAELMPKILNTQFFKAILDAHASEHGARMTAMDKASENAAEIIRSLKISYNRARQAAITTELTEIVSGAAALAG
ncbi:ATP synthase F1 subunit gamma [Chitinophaga pendula]|uniref:ATP synthase F1 subunit gamma n=1 Tax=Chitinophaga TaxID=79328 RepID=UPI000BAFBB54|nr:MULTISPECIES: ATP synthase F1 subunit gamma [Chitinophaga]ASZ09755.1 ATP synthase F1 subunit gamma [Chitinophaga sp. MD30]UCJ07304.1 ATP synthase F1 subunit gamma [Chitinophaga pendula]